MNFDNANCDSALRNPRRLEALYSSHLLDSTPDRILDGLTKIICRELNVPIALVCIVDAERQFFKAQHGLPPELVRQRGTSIDYSLCKYVVEQHSTIAIDDARKIPALENHPAVAERGIVAYLGAPLVAKGQVLGSVCAVDEKPRHWSEKEIRAIEKRANFIRSELDFHWEQTRKFGT